jgi:hypothetical protein
VTERTPGIDRIAGTHASLTRSVSKRDAPGGRDTMTLNESSLNGGKKLEPNPVATFKAHAKQRSERKITVLGKDIANERNGL